MNFNDASVLVTNFKVTSRTMTAEFYFVSMSEDIPLYNYTVVGTQCSALPEAMTADNAVNAFKAWAESFA